MHNAATIFIILNRTLPVCVCLARAFDVTDSFATDGLKWQIIETCMALETTTNKMKKRKERKLKSDRNVSLLEMKLKPEQAHDTAKR